MPIRFDSLWGRAPKNLTVIVRSGWFSYSHSLTWPRRSTDLVGTLHAWGQRSMGNRVSTTLAAVVIALAATSSCMTRIEGHRLQTSVAELRLRLDAVDKLDQTHKDQVIQLRGVLEQATALLTTHTRDVGAEENKAEADIAALQVQVDRLGQTIDRRYRQRADEQNRFQARLASLERGEAAIADKVAPLLPDDKDQLWQQAVRRLASGERDEGRRFFRVFIQRFPQDPRAPQAYLAIGTSFLQEKRFSSAAAAFQRLLDTFPASPEVPEATFQLSSAFVQLRFCTDARSLLRDVVKRYPASPPAAEARRELKVIEHLPKAECTS